MHASKRKATHRFCQHPNQTVRIAGIVMLFFFVLVEMAFRRHLLLLYPFGLLILYSVYSTACTTLKTVWHRLTFLLKHVCQNSSTADFSSLLIIGWNMSDGTVFNENRFITSSEHRNWSDASSSESEQKIDRLCLFSLTCELWDLKLQLFTVMFLVTFSPLLLTLDSQDIQYWRQPAVCRISKLMPCRLLLEQRSTYFVPM